MEQLHPRNMFYVIVGLQNFWYSLVASFVFHYIEWWDFLSAGETPENLSFIINEIRAVTL